MLGPLLGRVAIHSWSQGGTAWSLLVAREKPTARIRRLGQVGEGSGGRSDTWRHWAWRVCRKHRAGRFDGCSKTAPRTRFRQFFQNCPREDSRRTRGDIRGIASGRSKLLQVVAAVGWSSMYLSSFAPKGL